MKIYSELNIGTEAVDEDSDGIFYLNEMSWISSRCLNKKKGF